MHDDEFREKLAKLTTEDLQGIYDEIRAKGPKKKVLALPESCMPEDPKQEIEELKVLCRLLGMNLPDLDINVGHLGIKNGKVHNWYTIKGNFTSQYHYGRSDLTFDDIKNILVREAKKRDEQGGPR